MIITPPTRVSHAVTTLIKTGKQIAGATKIYLANVITGQTIIVGPFHR